VVWPKAGREPQDAAGGAATRSRGNGLIRMFKSYRAKEAAGTTRLKKKSSCHRVVAGGAAQGHGCEASELIAQR
jgi:hypothetical protein